MVTVLGWLDTILWAIWWSSSCGSVDALLQCFCSCIGYTSCPECASQCIWPAVNGHSCGLVGHWTLDRTPFCGRYGARHSMADNISLSLSPVVSHAFQQSWKLFHQTILMTTISCTFAFTTLELKARKYISACELDPPRPWFPCNWCNKELGRITSHKTHMNNRGNKQGINW